jgi:pyridinium-3,5-biscarboxylic acid mononucleotide sulfurtransferase
LIFSDLPKEPTITNLQNKYVLLQEILKGLGRVVIAYSGGVDSTFLLKVAVDTLGAENVLACIGISPSLAKSQYNQAIECAKIIGAEVEEVKLDEISDSRYSANKADRCFHCKSHLYSLLTEIAREWDFNTILCGSNFDDASDFRPGNRAAKVFDVKSPLMDAQLTKKDIRQLSKQLNLPTADKPASPCLASRINYGLQITKERLEQIEQAEDFLRQLGLVEFRVRHHETIARIEVKPQDLERIVTEPNKTAIVEKLKSLGFKYVTVDLQGFRSGSMNETLSDDQKHDSSV